MQTTELRAFHNDAKIKEKCLTRVLEHQKADEIIQGVYWENGKGCAVGCTIEGSDHGRYEKELGILKEIAHIEDAIFEGLDNKAAKKFPARFLKAVKVGADLSKVVPQFVIWQFEDERYGLKNIDEVKEDKEIYGFCEEVVNLYKRELLGDKPRENEYLELAQRIDGAGAWVGALAWAGAWARAWARAGAWARAWAGAGVGAWARAWAWAGVEAGVWAEVEYYDVMADKFISLIEEAK